jgi:hypothetical protein
MLQLHTLINHPYTRLVLVLVISIILAFIHRLDAFKTKLMYYAILSIMLLMIHACSIESDFHGAYMDFGFVILLMAMLVLTYNNIVLQQQEGAPHV